MLPYIRRALGPAQLQAESGAGETRTHKARWAWRFSGPPLHPARSARGSGGAGSNRRLGGHNPALCRLSYAPAVPLGQHSETGAPGRIRPDDLPLTRRALFQLSYRSGIAGVGFEPKATEGQPTSVAAYEAAALPLSYPAPPYRRRDLNSHGPSPRRSERRASAVPQRAACYSRMASAGIEPAARWASTSRSTGELQKPSGSPAEPTGLEPATPR